MAKSELLIPEERIEKSILFIRGHKVLLDSDLAELYGVETKNLNKAVQRNLARFPDDFMFRLTADEQAALRFQIGTSKVGRGGRRYRPYAFTEQGVAMLSSVLNSDRAIEVNIAIMRAFVRLREILSTHKDLAAKLDKMERKLGEHDQHFQVVFEAIRQLIHGPSNSPGQKTPHRIPYMNTTTKIGVGRTEWPRPPSLRTGLADLPHPALQLVVLPQRGLTDR